MWLLWCEEEIFLNRLLFVCEFCIAFVFYYLYYYYYLLLSVLCMNGTTGVCLQGSTGCVEDVLCMCSLLYVL